MPLCRVCGIDRLKSDFYAGKLRKCGTVGECKACTIERVKLRARTSDKVREYDRLRSKTEKRKAHIRKVSDRWREQNPLGKKAHAIVSYALRSGKIKKEPCLFCGCEKVHAHHKDYAEPLAVIWLCAKCHHRLHANFPETEGANKMAAE